MRRLSIALGLLFVLTALILIMGYRLLKWQSDWQTKSAEANAAYRNCVARYTKYRNFEQFHAGLHLPYVSPVPQAQWAVRFRRLQKGMSEHSVEQIMGVPDYAFCVMSKEGTRFMGSSWKYEIAVQVDEVNNSSIGIFFDAGGKMSDMYAANVKGIPNSEVLQQTRN